MIMNKHSINPKCFPVFAAQEKNLKACKNIDRILFIRLKKKFICLKLYTV